MSHIHAGRELFLEEMQELRVDVSRETRDQLEALVHTLGRWQKAINLVGKAPWRISGSAMSSIRPSSSR